MVERPDLVSVRFRWLLAIAVVLSLAGGSAAGAEVRPFGDARVVAKVPTPPGFPEGIATSNGLIWVSGPATFGTAGGPPSKVLVFHAATGLLIRSWDIQGEDLSREHANSSIALDRLLRAYVLNTQLGVTKPEQFTILDVHVADTGQPLQKALLP